MTKDYLKNPLKIEEQIEQMKKRGIIINDEKKAKHFLLHNNYYKFAFYYKNFADDKNHNINSENNFDFFYDLYSQDREIGNLLLKYIAIIEDSLRTQYAYFFSTKTEKSHPHLDRSFFICNDNEYYKLIDRLKECFAQSNLDYKKHYKENYKETLPPIWVMVECVPLGTIYHLIKKTDQQYVAEIFNNFNYPINLLKSFLNSLSFVRNLCAHNSIIWNINNQKLPKIPSENPLNNHYEIVELKETRIFEKLNFENQNTIINFILILYYLLKQINLEKNMKDDFNLFFKKLNNKYWGGYGIKDDTPLY